MARRGHNKAPVAGAGSNANSRGKTYRKGNEMKNDNYKGRTDNHNQGRNNGRRYEKKEQVGAVIIFSEEWETDPTKTVEKASEESGLPIQPNTYVTRMKETFTTKLDRNGKRQFRPGQIDVDLSEHGFLGHIASVQIGVIPTETGITKIVMPVPTNGMETKGRAKGDVLCIADRPYCNDVLGAITYSVIPGRGEFVSVLMADTISEKPSVRLVKGWQKGDDGQKKETAWFKVINVEGVAKMIAYTLLKDVDAPNLAGRIAEAIHLANAIAEGRQDAEGNYYSRMPVEKILAGITEAKPIYEDGEAPKKATAKDPKASTSMADKLKEAGVVPVVPDDVPVATGTDG